MHGCDSWRRTCRLWLSALLFAAAAQPQLLLQDPEVCDVFVRCGPRVLKAKFLRAAVLPPGCLPPPAAAPDGNAAEDVERHTCRLLRHDGQICGAELQLFEPSKSTKYTAVATLCRFGRWQLYSLSATSAVLARQYWQVKKWCETICSTAFCEGTTAEPVVAQRRGVSSFSFPTCAVVMRSSAACKRSKPMWSHICCLCLFRELGLTATGAMAEQWASHLGRPAEGLKGLRPRPAASLTLNENC